jgi:AraC family transcriptional regulator of adaptative response/methylated-DNA-[protein]-cysteine methyltransferase
MEPTALQKLFTRWAGLSPKGFLQAVTLDHARRLLASDLPLLDTAYEVGLSGPGRLHDLFVTHEAMSPGEYKAKGAGLTLRYGFHVCPFGLALVMVTERGLAGLAFCDPGGERAALEDMTGRWPNASYVEDMGATAPYAARIFDPANWRADKPLRVVLIGTDFQVSVWNALLKIPMGKALAYSDIASKIGRPDAPRAVGAAVGANPVSFVVPCHRAVGKSGALTGYHWGLTRKRAILGWEAGQLGTD